MIKEERLKELKKDNRTIYFLDALFDKVIELDSKDIEYGEDLQAYHILNLNKYKELYGHMCSCLHLISIFENKEDAEFKLRFGNVSKEDKFKHFRTLSLPLYNDLNKDVIIEFPINDNTYLFNIEGNDIVIRLINKDYGSYHNELNIITFDKELTKENYIQACEIIRYLFLWGDFR